MNNDYIKERISERISRRLKNITYNLVNLVDGDFYKFYVAGNSLNKSKPNDFDIYPVTECRFGVTLDSAKKLGCTILSETRNSTTIRLSSGVIIQLCDYYKPSLEELVKSFDYSHIQVGAELVVDEADFNSYSVEEVYFTEEYITSHVLETTWYTGSEYPISSLIRAFKYNKRENFSGNSYIVSVLNILNDIISRGVGNYDDFKDQLDAVDLQLLSGGNFDEVNSEMLTTLYNSLVKCKFSEEYNLELGKNPN